MNWLKQHCIALTGGIASGKSTVAKHLSEIGFHVIDADQVAREVVLPGSVGLNQLVQEFGSCIIDDVSGALDRKLLGELIFSDPAKKSKLEQVLHPLIATQSQQRLRDTPEGYDKGIVFYEAALVVENKRWHDFLELWVCYCPEAIQLARLQKRDQIDEQAAKKRLAAQMSPLEKNNYADFIINTSCSWQQVTLEIATKLQSIQALHSQTTEY